MSPQAIRNVYDRGAHLTLLLGEAVEQLAGLPDSRPVLRSRHRPVWPPYGSAGTTWASTSVRPSTTWHSPGSRHSGDNANPAVTPRGCLPVRNRVDGSAVMPRRVWTRRDVTALGVTTDLVTAGDILGIGRTTSHELARRGGFPVRVLRVGRRYVVPVAGLLRALDLPEPDPADPDRSVDGACALSEVERPSTPPQPADSHRDDEVRR